MKTHMATEDYLEAIIMLKEQRGSVRSTDVADLLGVTKPSVTYTTKRLREAKYITMDAGNLIELTEAGEKIAREVWKRHKMLTEFFIRIGVDKEIAEQDACKVEHDLSDETFAAVCKLADAQ